MKLLFHLSHTLVNQNFSRYLKYVKNNEYKSNEDLVAEQEKKLKHIIDYSYRYIPYYRNLFKNNNIDTNDIRKINDLEKIPILTKDMIRNNISDFYPRGKKIKFATQPTGGTTGTPMNFRVDKNNRMLGGVLLYRGWGYAGYNPGDKMVFLAGAALDVKTNNFLQFMHKISRNIIKLSSFDMDYSMMREYYYIINKTKPKYLRGYPSALYFFSKWIDDNHLNVYQPEGVFTTSEQCYPHMRENIENAFNCSVFDGYGLADGCLSTFECEDHNGLHIDTERGLLEVVDKEMKQIENEEGNILATSLENYSMPFIRYNTGDIGVKESFIKCSCERSYPKLSEIKGRSVDVFVTPNDEYVHGWFFLFIFWKYGENIKQYKVLQETKTNITIYIIPNIADIQKDLNIIQEEIFKKCELWKLNIKIVDKIPTTSSGKYKFIENLVKIY